jgi:hypothetical protein
MDLDDIDRTMADAARVIRSIASEYAREGDHLLRIVTVCRVGVDDANAFDFSHMGSRECGETIEETAEMIAVMLEARAKYIRENPAGKLME